MTTEEFTIELFFRGDEELLDVPKHSQARMSNTTHVKSEKAVRHCLLRANIR